MRWLIYGVAAVALIVAAGIAVLAVKVIEGGPTETGGLMGQPSVGGPFELVDGDGRTVTPADFAGKYMVLYFGFTYCPDVCPTELIAIADALDLLTPEQRARIQPIFVTVDPERDTPAVVKDYASNFHPQMIGLTGSPEQIREAAKAYRVYYAKQEADENGNYQMAHSSFIYVMGPDGRFLRHFSMGTSPEEIAEGLRSAM